MAQKPKKGATLSVQRSLEFGQGEAWQVSQTPALCQAELSFEDLWRTPELALLSEMQMTFPFYLRLLHREERRAFCMQERSQGL